MVRLINRQVQVPNGFRFLQPQTGWKPPRFASFDQIVQALVRHRKANPFLVEKHGWATDYDTVANEVDLFNARICQQMGWNKYITETEGESPAPFHQAPQPVSRLSAVAAGARTVVEWITSGAEAVPKEIAEKRAAKCTECPKNQKGSWEDWFTMAVSEAIRKAENQRREWKLETSHDEQLCVCNVCWCPLKLKVHMPIERIRQRIIGEVYEGLVPDCWIRTE